jgi:integrase
MKLKKAQKDDEARDHLVPLSKQALEVIAALRTLTGAGPLVFPNTRHAHKPMSENAIGYLLNRAGYHSKHVPHGWRSTFSSVMNETYPADKPIIDLMLAHVPKDKVEGAYNRALHLKRRKELGQLWADIIFDKKKPAAELLLGPRK